MPDTGRPSVELVCGSRMEDQTTRMHQDDATPDKLGARVYTTKPPTVFRGILSLRPEAICATSVSIMCVWCGVRLRFRPVAA